MSKTMSMGPLFDITSNRHGGNAESVAAFQSIKDRLPAQRKEVLHWITVYTKAHSGRGLTVDELAEVMHKTPNAISGRVSELKRDGRIYKAGTRLTRSGCKAAVLKAV